MTRGPEPGAEDAIPGGVDVTSSITANVWEVHVKVWRMQCTAHFDTLRSHQYGSQTAYERLELLRCQQHGCHSVRVRARWAMVGQSRCNQLSCGISLG